MFGSFSDRQILSADDVFHHWSNWREISRDEAVAAVGFDPVVVLFRNGSSDCADWFETDHPFFRGVGPHWLGGVRYYRYLDRRIFRPREAGATASVAAPPAQPPRKARQTSAPEVKSKTWIEIELLDEEGIPVANEPYTILLPDGTTQKGSLDSLGRARVDGIDPGSCQVSFPNIDQREWRAA